MANPRRPLRKKIERRPHKPAADRKLRIERLEGRRMLSLTADSFSAGVLTINFNAADNVAITTSGGDVLVNGSSPTTGVVAASAITSISITGLGNYDNTIDLSGVSSATGFTSLATVSINAGGSVSGDTVKLGTFDASGLVSVTGTGTDAVILPTNLYAGSLSITATTVDLQSVTTTGNQTYNAAVLLAGNAVLSSGVGDANITFDSTIDGGYALSVISSGVTTFGGAIGGNAAVGGLTTAAAGTTVLDGSVTSNSYITFNNPVTLGASATLSDGPTTLTMQSVDGPYNLTLDTWYLALDGSLGANTPLASLTTNVPFGFTFAGGSIVTTGTQSYGGDIVLGGDATFDSTAGQVQLAGLDGDYNVTVNAASGDDLSKLGINTPLASLTIGAAGTTAIGDVSTAGNQIYNNPVTLGFITNVGSHSGNITFNNTVNGSELNVGTDGTMTFNAPVGQTSGLSSLTIEGGTAVLAGGSLNASTVTVFGAVVLESNTTVNSTSGSSVAFYGTVDGDYALTVDRANTAAITFGGAVGATTPLASLSISAGDLSLQSVFTVGGQTYNDPGVDVHGLYSSSSGSISLPGVTLEGNAVINAAGAVSVSGVNGSFSLNILSGSSTTLGAVAAAALTVSSASGVTIYGYVTTTGNQIYSLPVTLGYSWVTLTSTAGTVSELASVPTAPVLTPIAPSLAPVVDNQASSTAESVLALVGNSITDDNYDYGIAVTAASSPGGTWQFSLNNGTTWTTFGSVSASQSLLLAPADLVRFAPDGVDTGTAAFTYVAWNQTTGTPGTTANTTTGGGNTAFSTASDTASIVVQIVPVITIDTFSGGVLTVNVDGGENITITSSGGDVLVNGANPTTGVAAASAVTAVDITATAGRYDNVFDLTDVSAASGFTSLATVTINTGGAYFGDQVRLGELDASGLVSITGSGADTVVLPTTLIAASVSITATTVDMQSVTTTGNQTYDAAVTLTGNATVSAGSGNLTFGSTIDGAYTLTTNSSAATTFNGTVGGKVSLGSLTTDAAGSTVLAGPLVLADSITLNNPATLGGNVELFATGIGTAVTVHSVDGPYNLILSAWHVVLDSSIGANTPLASLAASDASGFTTSVGGSIVTTGTQSYSGAMAISGDTTFESSAGQVQLYALDGSYNVTINAAAGTSLWALGTNTPLASLAVSAAGATSLGNVVTTGNQTYSGPVTLEGSTLDAGSGNVTFNSTVDSGIGLTINTTGITTFNGPLGQTSALFSLTIGAGGSTVLAGGSISTKYGITFGSPVVLGSNMTLGADGFPIDFSSTVDGPYSLSLSGSGILGTTFAAAVGGNTPLASLTSAGGPLSLQSVTTTGSQTYNDQAVELDGSYTAASGQFSVANGITLLGNSAINADGVDLQAVDGDYGLNIITGGSGAATLDGTIGGATPLWSITVASSAGTNIYANVTTTGNQIYQLPVTVAAGVRLLSTSGTVSEVASIPTAPVLTPIAPVFSPITVNEPSSPVESIASLIGNSITDNTADSGIAVIGQSGPGGSWQFSLNGTTWTNFGSVSASQSLLLAPSDLVRFVPDGVDTGTATFTYLAWNGTTGTPGTAVSTTSTGGNTAFSTASDTASILIQVPATITTDSFSSGVLTIDVDGAQNVAITSSGGDVLVNGANPTTGVALASAVTAIDITAMSGDDDKTFDLSGVSAATGFTSLATVAINAGGSYYGDQVLLGELDASGLVSITGTGTDAVTLPTSLVAGSLSITATTVNLQSVTTSGNQTYNSAVTLTGEATLSAGSGNVTFDSTLDGGYDLTVDSSGVTTFGGTVGGNVALSSLTTDAAGSTVLDASVSTNNSGGMTFNDPVTLGASVTLSAGMNTVTMHAVDGPYSLTFDTWNLALDGSIGANTPLASLTANIPFAFTFVGGSIVTAGAQTYGGDLVIGGDTTFNSGSAEIQMGGLDGAHHVTFDSSGLTYLQSDVGDNTPLASLSTDAAGTVTVNGDVTTVGNQTYNNPVTLGATTLNAGSGNITFNSPVNSGALIINTTGTTSFNGPVGQTSLVGDMTISAGGTTVLAGGSIGTTFGATFGSPVVLESNMTINGGSSQFNSTVNGAYSLTLESGGTFAAAVGATTPLASLASPGGSLSLRNVTTTGSQIYNAYPVQLDGFYSAGGQFSIEYPTTLLASSAIAASGVSLGSVDGDDSLNITSSATTTLGGVIGGSTPLASLTVNSASGVTIDANVTTIGNQTYTLPVTLAQGIELSSSAGTVSGVVSVATAPVLTPIAPSFSQVNVNAASSTSESVETLVGNSITDNMDDYGIAVTADSSPGGSWQYSLTGTTWTNFPSVSATGSLLLAPSNLVRFVPDGVDTGTATFTYRGWNQSSGLPGTTANTTVNGGNSAFSTATDTASIVIQIAPVITTDTFSAGVLTINVDGSENVSITSSGGDVLVNGSNPTTGVALASAVTAIDMTATPGDYDNIFNLNGVSAATGFTSLATVAVNTGGSYKGDQVDLGALNGLGLVSITGAGADSVSLAANFVAGSLSITATRVNLQSVTTSGNQTYNAVVQLTGNATLSAGAGNVTFSSTVDAHNLTVDSSGVTTFGGSVEVGSLTTGAAGSTVLDASVSIETGSGPIGSGLLTFNNPVTLGANVTLTDNVHAVTMDAVDGPYSLTFDALDLALDGSIGANTPLASLTSAGGTLSLQSVTTAGSQTYNDQAVQLDGLYTTTAGNFSIENAATLLGNSVINASGTANLGSVNGPYGLNIVSGGLATLGGPIGQTSPLSSLTVDSATGVDIDANVTTTGNQVYSLPVTVAPGVNLVSTKGTVTESASIGSAPVLTPNAPNLWPVIDSQATSTATLVSTLVANSITDDNRVYGIAIVGLTSPGGTWQYSQDGGSTWTDVGSVSPSQALLLEPSDFIRFAPQPGGVGQASITFRAWDEGSSQPSDATGAGGYADTTENGGNTSFSTAMDTVSMAVDAGPTVLGVFASGSTWSSTYLSVLAGAGLGDSVASVPGFPLADGANQLTTTLPWSNVNQLSIAFNEPVNVSQSSLTLYNSTGGTAAISSFSYNSTTYVATWQFSSSLSASEYLINLAAASVTDGEGIPLDGSWTTGVSTFVAGSGDGTPGGDFNFYFNVLPGDANSDGAVNGTDLLFMKLDAGSPTTTSNYRYDLQGSGTISSSYILPEKLNAGLDTSQFVTPALPAESMAQIADVATIAATNQPESIPVSSASPVTSLPAISLPAALATPLSSPVTDASEAPSAISSSSLPVSSAVAAVAISQPAGSPDAADTAETSLAVSALTTVADTDSVSVPAVASSDATLDSIATAATVSDLPSSQVDASAPAAATMSASIPARPIFVAIASASASGGQAAVATASSLPALTGLVGNPLDLPAVVDAAIAISIDSVWSPSDRPALNAALRTSGGPATGLSSSKLAASSRPDEASSDSEASSTLDLAFAGW